MSNAATQSLDQKMDELHRNVTSLRSEMLRSEISFQLHVKQDTDNRLRLEQELADVKKNNSVLQTLYEAALQEITQLKESDVNRTREMEQLSRDRAHDLKIFNENISRQVKEMMENITSLQSQMRQGKGKVKKMKPIAKWYRWF